MSKKKSGRRVWRGVTTATASLLALSVCASTVVDGFRTDIDKFLGTKSTKLVTENSDGTDLYNEYPWGKSWTHRPMQSKP